MSTTAQLKNVYAEQIAPALMKQFNYSSPMQIPVLKKIVVNQGLGQATADKKAGAADACNAAIADGQIVKGATVIVMYNKQEVSGTVTNTPTEAAKNIPVSSDAFANKDKFLYVPKQNFVRMG